LVMAVSGAMRALNAVSPRAGGGLRPAESRDLAWRKHQ